EYYRDGRWIKNGRILAAEFVNVGSKYQAFYFEDGKGHGDYYDSEGRCLRKQFLKSPLRYKRISSYFSRRRFHPILKIYRPHLGIDYAAPVGTPVESIGDGKIEFIGWKGDYGRFIRVKHNRNYITTYGHLSRFAKGLKKGSRIKQGQVIGYVGSTGLATGPHLDFRMIRNGRFVNPLKIQPPPVAPIRKESMEAFNATVLNLAERLKAISLKASVQVQEDTYRERKGG
ncbi:MAG TPA: M23 family metallopeptidase, partial [Syntrophaceae bacterium]|nr:M23 family metallopeptidase [Syntrophaceae bacterium]